MPVQFPGEDFLAATCRAGDQYRKVGNHCFFGILESCIDPAVATQGATRCTNRQAFAQRLVEQPCIQPRAIGKCQQFACCIELAVTATIEQMLQVQAVWSVAGNTQQLLGGAVGAAHRAVFTHREQRLQWRAHEPWIML
ncbi:hypothetical protein D3C77_539170 [compost metagenome]